MRERKRSWRRLAALVVIALLSAMVPLGGARPAAAAATTVFINEIHYDNDSTDAGEAIEIAGPAGTDLAGWSLELYNGNGGALYDTISLSGTIPDLLGGYGTLSFATPDLQNGSPDGVALVDSSTTVVQFLSYEGSFTATSGTASGMTSTDIGVEEPYSTPMGHSLQLGGLGFAYEDFTWNPPAPNTFGAVNIGQSFQEPGPRINEFSASTTGTDVEYVEIYGDPDTDYSAYSVLEIEGDGTGAGVVDEVIPIGTTDADGFYLADLAADTLENGTITLMLVLNFTGSAGSDLDADNDGTFDTTPWDEIGDAVAVTDGGLDDITYGVPELYAYYDGLAYAPGGASRIPDGFDTESITDWVRNDFDLAGIPGYDGTPVLGEAYNTPGAPNEVYVPPPEGCGDPYTAIYEVQGSGMTSPLAGDEVAIEGVVVGDFQNNDEPDDGDLNGFHVQDPTGDSDSETSDGIFVYAPSGIDVSAGDRVRVRGSVSEYYDMTQISSSNIWVCSTGNTFTTTAVTLPITSTDYLERYEGMLITFPQDLYISEYYNFDRYGEIVLTTDRQYQPTAIYNPDTPDAEDLAEANALARILMDDGRTTQNPDPAIHPNGAEFTLDNLFRGGDIVQNVTGVLDYSHSFYRIQPTEGADYVPDNPRPAEPEDVGTGMKVVAFNVLNYFTTIDEGQDNCGPSQDMECRGADTAEEFERQRTKIITALVGIDADVVGVIEIENYPGDVPVEDLVTGLNDELGAGTYDYIATGAIGTDAIRVALLYKPAAVTPVGPYAILDSSVDVRFLDEYNRPVLAQTFRDLTTDGLVTVAVNHLKSKGSACELYGIPDPECNVVRTLAARALVDWLADDPTGSGDPDSLIIGDLNSYDKENPIDVLLAGGYTDLVYHFQGEYAYSYVFDGQLGYLDYALSSTSLTPQVTGTTVWHINADEPDLIDYDMTYKQDAQDALYAPDAYRSSDHDPVIVGLDLLPKTTISKTVSSTTPDFQELITYTVQLANTDGAGDTIVLTDTLPTQVQFAGWIDQPTGAVFEEGDIRWAGMLTPGQTLTFTFAVTNTVSQETVTNVAHFRGTQQVGSDAAVFHAGGWRVVMPLIMKSHTP